jgi:uncharacterized protein
MEATTVRHTANGEGAEQQAGRIPPVAPVIGDPAPLGLAAFALTTFVLSFFNAGLVSDKGVPVVLGLALAYGGITQLLAGMWEFRNNNTFGATAFCSFGAFWISFFVLQQFHASKIPTANLGKSVGLYLIAWGIFTTYMWVASFRVSIAVNLVFLFLAATFIVLGIGNANANTSTIHIAGWLGIVTAVLAWYASFAGVTNRTFGRIVLPVRELKK